MEHLAAQFEMRNKGRSRNEKALPAIPMSYRGHTLDSFQAEAIMRIQQDTSVLVGAPTGTGKSLIAQFLVEQALNNSLKVYYTAPIKALVNQKYREFAEHYGTHQCGMMTGDVTIRPDAGVVVMTTEVLRNRLLREETPFDARWVVFDEIHYLSDPERGTVWEECILLLPQGTRVLGLSATVPNIESLAAWLEAALNDVVVPVVHEERAVPLRHLYFNERCEAIPHEDIWERIAASVLPDDDDFDSKAGTSDLSADLWSRIPRTMVQDRTTHLDLARYLERERLFPCIYFDFSRRSCEDKAQQLARRRDYLRPYEKELVRAHVQRVLREAGVEASRVPHLAELRSQWSRGIGFHHAGLLPIVRRIVESLLEARLLRIVYATETFAVGVNMPVRTVCFDGLEKFDGRGYRLLTPGEYFQMAGRAGRRGYDKEGTVIALVNLESLEKIGLYNWDEAELQPVTSRFRLTYTTVLNLFARFELAEIAAIFERSLYVFQAEEAKQGLIEMLLELKARLETLRRLGYIDEGRLQPKGQFCRGIWVKELLVTELASNGTLSELTPEQLAGWAAATVWEPRHGAEQLPYAAPAWTVSVQLADDRLRAVVPRRQAEQWRIEPRVAPLLEAWASGQPLDDVLQLGTLESGDFVALCRQCIDLLRQIAQSASEPALLERVGETIALIDRDIVAAAFI